MKVLIILSLQMALNVAHATMDLPVCPPTYAKTCVLRTEEHAYSGQGDTNKEATKAAFLACKYRGVEYPCVGDVECYDTLCSHY